MNDVVAKAVAIEEIAPEMPESDRAVCEIASLTAVCGVERAPSFMPESAFTAGWVLTLLKARELGLDAAPANDDFRNGNDTINGTAAVARAASVGGSLLRPSGHAPASSEKNETERYKKSLP